MPKPNLIKRLLLTFVFVFVACLSGECQDGQGTNPAKRILFVGNSLTYTNNLPDLVNQLAIRDKLAITVETLAFANYALEDHWNDGQLQKLITSGGLDFVVVQQGPSSQAEGREMLFLYGEKIKGLCRRQKVQLAFFMVWPARANYLMFDGVIRNYTEAAQQTNSLLCPVGKVWKEHFEATHDYSYYGPDEFHPSLKGSEAAAQVIYKTLFP